MLSSVQILICSPPSPPPFPPPRPPSPPMDNILRGPPIIWGAVYIGGILLVVMVVLVYVAINNRKFFPRVRNPEELRARLAGEYYATSDDDISVDGYSNISDIDEDLDLAELNFHRERQFREQVAADAVLHEEGPGDITWGDEPGTSRQHEKLQ